MCLFIASPSLDDQAYIDATMFFMCAYIVIYDLWNVFNMDEMRLFDSMVPNQTITQQKKFNYKKETTYITIAFTINADIIYKFPPFFY